MKSFLSWYLDERLLFIWIIIFQMVKFFFERYTFVQLLLWICSKILPIFTDFCLQHFLKIVTFFLYITLSSMGALLKVFTHIEEIHLSSGCFLFDTFPIYILNFIFHLMKYFKTTISISLSFNCSVKKTSNCLRTILCNKVIRVFDSWLCCFYHWHACFMFCHHIFISSYHVRFN